MIYLAADHRGFDLKESIKTFLKEELKLVFEDLGNFYLDPEDDYPDFGKKVAEAVAKAPNENKGILFCGTGIGMDIVANRYAGVRSALAWNEAVVRQSRENNDANILTLPADFLDLDGAKKIIKIWLETEFSKEEKHKRRINKIDS